MTINISVRQMEFVLELARVKNFNRAAKELFVSQPTLTYQIRQIEEAAGFPIFLRTPKGVALTPAGEQFAATLQAVTGELSRSIEQCRNFASRYSADIRVMMPIRSALFFLPEAIREFCAANPGISVTPGFNWDRGLDIFLRGGSDVLFALEDDVKAIPELALTPLFKSRIYLVCPKGSALARKKTARAEDLAGQTLMVGGPSPAPLRAVQSRVTKASGCSYFTSQSHDMSLTYVASGTGVVLSPGFLNDHSGMFAWVPFECGETISCVLCTHRGDRRPMVSRFLRTLLSLYERHPDFPV